MAAATPNAREIFLTALDRPPAGRAAYLDEVCGADAALRQRVEALLRAHDEPGPFLSEADSPAGATADLRPPVEPGAVVAGRYALQEKIGEGGMGEVWVARQTEPVKRRVALKLIKAGMDSKAVLVRFEAERQALAIMDHPNIAKVLDGGLHEQRPFFVMELVKGVPITEYCDQHRFTPHQRLELFVPVCQAIQHAHQKGVIHRDIKPSNVLVALYDDRPVPKVIDFGVAKAAGSALTDRTLMTGFGAVVGTPEYMSPEQASLNNLDIDTRSDVYSLGVLLYELLTGTTPVDRKSLDKAALLEVLRIVREVEAPKPSAKLSTIDTLPTVAANRGTEPAKLSRLMKGELDWVLLKALEKDRTRRYETANALGRDIQRYLADEVVEARPPSTGYRLRKFVHRHKGRVLAAAAVAAALVVGVGAVVAVQARANQELADKNDQLAAEQAKVQEQNKKLAAEQAKVEARNKELAAEQAKVEAWFDRAVRAIRTFHTGVCEDALLKNPQFRELRLMLLQAPLQFYADLEVLLAGQTDAKSRRALATGYFRLGDLMEKIGDQRAAREVQHKALAIRRELAAAPGADVETRLDVARSLQVASRGLYNSGDRTAALHYVREMRDVAAALEAEAPTEAVRQLLAQGHYMIGINLGDSGKPAEALEAHRRSLAIRQKLADGNPADEQFQRDLALSHVAVGNLLGRTGKPAEQLEPYRKALAIIQKLFDANSGNNEFRGALAEAFREIGDALSNSGRPAEALEAHRKALAIYQKRADTQPAAAALREDLASAHNGIGRVLLQTGRPVEALESFRMAAGVRQKLFDANPEIREFEVNLAPSLYSLGVALLDAGRPAEALEAHRKALTIYQERVEAQPTSAALHDDLARAHSGLGRVLLRTGSPAQALDSFRRAAAIWQALVNADPLNRRWERDLASLHMNVGEALGRQKQLAEALTVLDRSLTVRQQSADTEPTNLSYRRALGWSHGSRGAVRTRAGRPAEAAADLRKALELWAKLPQLDVEIQVARAQAMANLAGLGADAKSGVTKEEAKTFADQSVAALAAVVELGWALPSELDEPDFDALRGRADFQKLVAAVAAKVDRVPETAPPPHER